MGASKVPKGGGCLKGVCEFLEVVQKVSLGCLEGHRIMFE